MRSRLHGAVGIVGAVIALGACGSTSRPGGGPSGGPRERTAAAATRSGACPVSTPAGPRPPALALLNFGDPLARPSDAGFYGNGVLWTVLPWSHQTISGPDPSIHLKIPWFRAAPGVVTVTAVPLHGGPARFSADVGSPASYGTTGFAPSILRFGRAGCWRLHAHLASHVLTLIVRITRAA